MNEITHVLPEATLAALACVVLLVDVFKRSAQSTATFWAALVAGLATLGVVTLHYPEATTLAFNGTYVADPMGAVLKAFALALIVVSFLYARDYFGRKQRTASEFFILALFAGLGMMVLVSSHSLLTLYLGLELLSLSLYAMVAMERDSGTAAEAAMKYFVLGALASGLLLYGISMLYGVGGTLDLGELAQRASRDANPTLFAFGIVFVLIGVTFKLGVAPFHMWVPDVYQGAATPVTLFISTAPKLAAFAMAVRLLGQGLPAMSDAWVAMLALLAVVSMGLGNVVAIAQSNLKRMLAYSTVAHMGFLLLGVVAATAAGFAASMFYVIVYAVMSMAAFGAIILLSGKDGEADELADFSGLATRRPWLAFLVLVIMFSLAGVPPFAGFWAKWFVLKEVIASGHVGLAAIAVLFSLVGAFYYLRVVKLMYFDAGSGAPGQDRRDSQVGFVFTMNGLIVVALGLLPGALMSVCLTAVLASVG